MLREGRSCSLLRSSPGLLRRYTKTDRLPRGGLPAREPKPHRQECLCHKTDLALPILPRQPILPRLTTPFTLDSIALQKGVHMFLRLLISSALFAASLVAQSSTGTATMVGA